MENTTSDNRTQDIITTSAKVTKQYGTSYYLATLFFPRDIRHATWVLYTFFRLPDEIVDTEEQDMSIAQSRLSLWKKDWQTDVPTHEVLHQTKKIFQEYKIPYIYGDIFIDAMISDTEKSRYQTFDELKKYMYGSASIVGIIMSYIIGYNGEALPYAEKLGYAMQLTNFLRDIDEDYTQRNRIYFPKEEWDMFGIDESYFKEKKYDDAWKQFIMYQIAKTHALYRESETGIQLLSSRGRLSVYIASALYEKILNKIEQVEYNIWNKRVRTTLWEKIYIVLYCYTKKHSK